MARAEMCTDRAHRFMYDKVKHFSAGDDSNKKEAQFRVRHHSGSRFRNQPVMQGLCLSFGKHFHVLFLARPPVTTPVQILGKEKAPGARLGAAVVDPKYIRSPRQSLVGLDFGRTGSASELDTRPDQLHLAADG